MVRRGLISNGARKNTVYKKPLSPNLDAAFLLTVGSFLLTVELFILTVVFGSFFAYSSSVFTYNWSSFTSNSSFFCLQLKPLC